MKTLLLKLKLIYYPFLLVATGFIFVYSLLNWSLTMRTSMLPLHEDMTDLWLPLILPYIPLFIWIWPRVKFLNLKTKRGDNLPFGFIFLGAFAIGVPCLIFQGYLRTATGQLTKLDSISQIRANPLTKYYSVQHYFVDTDFVRLKNIAAVSGKHNEYLDYTIYVATPVFDRRREGVDTSGEPAAWVCTKYHKQISNRLSKEVKEAKWRMFFSASMADLSKKDPNDFVYLDRTGSSDDRDYYAAAIKKSDNFKHLPSSPIILEPRSTPFEDRSGHKGVWSLGSFGIGAVAWLLVLLIPGLDVARVEAANGGIPASGDIKRESREMLAFLIPREGYFVVPLLIDLNLLIFILMALSGKGFINFQGADLLSWGANYRPLTLEDGQWWRLLTCIFLHAGVMHVVFNMAGLLFAGVLLEPALGSRKIAAVYLITGIASSLASLWWHPATISIGASGAIFGLYGVFLALLTTQFFPPVFKKSFTISILVFVGGNLLIGLSGGIDNAAHIGGLVSGLLAGYILYPFLKGIDKPGGGLQEPEGSLEDLVQVNNGPKEGGN